MTRWLPAVALGALLALAAAAVLVVIRPGEEPTRAERVEALAAELRCPDCQGLSVLDSPTGSAREIRRQIDELVAAGASDAEVREHFVARYGEWIRLAPSLPLLWILPFVVLLAAVAGLVAWLRPGRNDPPPAPPALGEDERRRLREEAEALDA